MKLVLTWDSKEVAVQLLMVPILLVAMETQHRLQLNHLFRDKLVKKTIRVLGLWAIAVQQIMENSCFAAMEVIRA